MYINKTAQVYNIVYVLLHASRNIPLFFSHSTNVICSARVAVASITLFPQPPVQCDG